MRDYLSDSKKNDVTVKIFHGYQKTITNEMKRKGDTVPTKFKKIRSVKRWDVTEFGWKTHCFYWVSPCVLNPKHPEREQKPKRLYIAFLAERTENLWSKKW